MTSIPVNYGIAVAETPSNTGIPLCLFMPVAVSAHNHLSMDKVMPGSVLDRQNMPPSLEVLNANMEQATFSIMLLLQDHFDPTQVQFILHACMMNLVAHASNNDRKVRNSEELAAALAEVRDIAARLATPELLEQVAASVQEHLDFDKRQQEHGR